MWKILPYSKPFSLSFTKNNGYCIYITNYINIWWVSYSENEFLVILKSCNDDLEMDSDDQLIQMGLKMLHDPENLKKLNLTVDNKVLNVSMTLSCGYPIYLDMKLTEGSKELFFQVITQTLLKTVHDLKTSENELRFSLIKKDKEIEEYKTETDVRLAMYLKTAMFNDEEHMRKHPVYKRNFGTSDVPSSLLDRVIVKIEDEVNVKEERQEEEARVKIEPKTDQHIKTEPETLLPEALDQDILRTIPVKREIKNETQITSPNKKLRKRLKI